MSSERTRTDRLGNETFSAGTLRRVQYPAGRKTEISLIKTIFQSRGVHFATCTAERG